MIGLVIGLVMLAAAIARWARHRWLVITVVGQSMVPTLQDGQRIIAHRPRSRRLAVGEVVVFRLPEPQLREARASGDVAYRVKRIAAVGGDAMPAWLTSAGIGEQTARVPETHFAVIGDAAASEDSRQLGLVSRDQILAWLPHR